MLRRRGAVLGARCFFADPGGISGNLTKLSIGSETYIGRAVIAVHDEVVIGSGVCINDETQILTASHDVSSPSWETVTSAVTIEDHAWIAVRCLILPGVTIGRGAVVGAGAVVSKDVAPFSVVAGNPARPLTASRPTTLAYSPVDHLALIRAWKCA